jgi:hypothetical protein
MAQLAIANVTAVYWNFDTNDFRNNMTIIEMNVDKYPSPAVDNTPVDSAITEVGPSIAPGLIMLMNLANNMGLCALPVIIDRVRFKGWNFVTGDQCYGVASHSPITVLVPAPTTETEWPNPECTTAGPIPVIPPSNSESSTGSNGGTGASGASGASGSGSGSGSSDTGASGGAGASGSNGGATGSGSNGGNSGDTGSNNGASGANGASGSGSTTGSTTGSSGTNTTTDTNSSSSTGSTEVVNVCATNNGGCAANTICTNNNGTAICGGCRAGYIDVSTVNSTTLNCTDINECAINNNACSPLSTCINNAPTDANPALYMCTPCPSGYSGNGTTCTDINECLNNNCDVAAVCTNSPGSYQCACRQGFTGTGVIGDCANINECATNNGGCSIDPAVACHDATPSAADSWIIQFTCDPCPAGYEGDGKTCVLINNDNSDNSTSSTSSSSTGSDKDNDPPAQFSGASSVSAGLLVTLMVPVLGHLLLAN